VLDVTRLRKSFDGFLAVGGVSFSVPRGSISAIIGPNGAGKTTLFNLITGHLRPDAGSVRFKEREVTGIAPHDLCRLGMGRSFQRTNIFPKLTVFENIQAAYLSHRGRGWNLFTPVGRLYRDETEALLASVGLLDKANEVAGFLSHGNQKQIELGIALALEPEILLLDEPTAGMSPEETQRMTRMLEGLPREVTLLIIEHDMDVVASLADRVTVLHYGLVLTEGTFDEVKRDPRVYEVYLGSE
jgi:branched-chain amino acid transport system ATP-binding protein